MKNIFLLWCFIFIGVTSMAQKNNNEIQAAVHYGFPTGNLSNITNGGFGGSIKGLYGFSRQKQQLTLSAGYTHFPVKNSIAGEFNFFYSSLPVMVGYRYTFGQMSMDGGLYLEAQAGGTYNTIKGSGGGGASVKTTGISFAFSPGIGYQYKGFDVGVFYQNSQLADSDNDITFFAVQIGYAFAL